MGKKKNNKNIQEFKVIDAFEVNEHYDKDDFLDEEAIKRELNIKSENIIDANNISENNVNNKQINNDFVEQNIYSDSFYDEDLEIKDIEFDDNEFDIYDDKPGNIIKRIIDDEEINELITKTSDFSISDFISDVKDIRKKFHVKTNSYHYNSKSYSNDNNLLEGSEETLINELKKFNAENNNNDITIFSLFNSEQENNLFLDEEKKRKEIERHIEEELKTVKYDKTKFKILNIKRSFYISSRKFMMRFKIDNSRFINTYGSNIFSRISNWILEEQNLYENIDRLKLIEKMNKKKVKLAKKHRERRK